MKLLLLGYMGSGKTAVGERLAEVLDIPFYDLALEIEKGGQKSVPEIFSEKGEIYFRKREVEVLQELLKSDERFVLSLGGGTPCYGNVMQIINKRAGVTSIFLKASVETLTHRLFPAKQHRPLIAHLQTEEELNDFIRKHLFERNFYYHQAALTVHADTTVREIISEIVARLF